MIVIRTDNDSIERINLSKVLYYKKDFTDIVFYFNQNCRTYWKFKDEKESLNYLHLIDYIINQNKDGIFSLDEIKTSNQ